MGWAANDQNLFAISARIRHATRFDGSDFLIEIQQGHIVIGVRPGYTIVGGTDFLMRTVDDHLFRAGGRRQTHMDTIEFSEFDLPNDCLIESKRKDWAQRKAHIELYLFFFIMNARCCGGMLCIYHGNYI